MKKKKHRWLVYVAIGLVVLGILLFTGSIFNFSLNKEAKNIKGKWFCEYGTAIEINDRTIKFTVDGYDLDKSKYRINDYVINKEYHEYTLKVRADSGFSHYNIKVYRKDMNKMIFTDNSVPVVYNCTKKTTKK